MYRRLVVIVFAVVTAAGAQAWTTPVNLGSVCNSSGQDRDPWIDGTGSVIYFASTRPGGYGNYDIWRSTYAAGWQAPVNLGAGVNSGADEEGPCYYAGATGELYFGSDRNGGQGNLDIWRSYYEDGNWVTPSNLGSVVNRNSWDGDPFVIGNPPTLYFVSVRSGGYGGFDIWSSRYINGSGWQTPVNLGPNVNSSSNEDSPSLTADGRYLYFGSARPGGRGGSDIWVCEYNGGSWGPAVNLGASVNTSAQEVAPCITPGNGRLVFASNRTPNYGAYDIWYTDNGTVGIAPSSLGRVKAAFK